MTSTKKYKSSAIPVKNGLRDVIMQVDKVIAYASRALTDTEQHYAEIEKEMLSIMYSCTKFHSYIFGKSVTVYNDHKPLEQFSRHLCVFKK